MVPNRHPRRPVGLVSVGYGGRRLRSLVDLLTGEGVELLIDVRLTPVSGIPGFSAGSLRRVLGDIGIEYRHAPELGNPPDNRAPFHEGPREQGRSRFRKLLRSGAARKALEDLVMAVAQRRVAVLCAERDQERCHRQVIVERIRQLSPGLAVTVLN
jgi:uncharacterized protein (DUF488 family)